MTSARRWTAIVCLAAALGVIPGIAAGQAVGDAGRGRAVFEATGCIRCHLPRAEGSGMGPALEAIRRPQGALEVAGRLWNHAPAMFTALEKQGAVWPELRREEMADLLAYLQADPARDGAPDLFQGQAVLVRKGCLKCHRLRGEGGALASELTADPTRLESPVAWVTAIWLHSPRMAGRAAEVGLLYPRFTGDEMGNLVGFLRSAARSR